MSARARAPAPATALSPARMTRLPRRSPVIEASADALEQEADRVADQVLAGVSFAAGAPTPLPQLRPLRSVASAAHSGSVFSSVSRARAEPGTALPPGVRRDMERHFAHDFSQVRVHAGPLAGQSASDIGAEAYTSGNDIVFGSGRFAPQRREGQRLLAHELTHVVQQSNGAAAGRVQAKPGVKKPGTARELALFKLQIDHAMDADELRHAFVMKYYGYSTEAQVQTKLSLWTAARGTLPHEVERGYVTINVISNDKTDIESLEPKQRDEINKETDRRFWENTGQEPGRKLGTSAKDREMAQVWIGTRNAVLTEDKQRRDIEALPKDIKEVMFAGGVDASAVSADQYTQFLRIANKLAALPPDVRKDYLARVNASTGSLDLMEGSVDSYLQFQKQREQQQRDVNTVSKPLFGAEGVYDRYRFNKVFMKDVTLGADATKEDQELANKIKQANDEALLADLKRNGFDSVQAFEAALEAYRIAFRTQAVNLALDVLSRYDHMLFEERKKLQQPGAAAAIAQGIAGSTAAAQYKEYHEQTSIARSLRVAHEPKETWWIKPAMQAESAAREAHATAESEVIRGSGNDPLVAERGTDREKLAGLDAAGTQAYLAETLNKRQSDIQSARKEFNEDPDRVFKLKDLVEASMKIQNISRDTVYGKAITDYIHDEEAKHFLSQLALGILALALAFLVPGGGWLAAAALVANAGISTYQAYVAYQEYEQQERDYRLHFLAEEPSLFWVGIAVAAAALDLGVATSTIVKSSANALKALEPTLMGFAKNEVDLATLASRIEAAEGLRPEIKAAMQREAASAKAADEAMAEFSGRAYGMMPGFVDPGAAKQAFRAFYYMIKRGVNSFIRLRADAKYMKALGDITKMTGAERAELEAAFEEVKQLVSIGAKKGMDETSLLNYVDRLAINRGNPAFKPKLLDEMNLWKPLSAAQERALNALNVEKQAVTTLYERKDIALQELEELLAKPGKTSEEIQTVRDLEKELKDLDPTLLPQKTPGPHPAGQIADAEGRLARAEAEAARAELTLYDRLRAAAPSAPARERALKGVVGDQVGGLKTRPTALEPDHIVSVREISDMDDFNKLLWKDQKAITDMKENLVAMDSSANRSKGGRTWNSWNQAGDFYEKSAIDAMIARETQVRQLIRDKIQEALAKLGSAKP